jgi:uncharacterized membrane protein YczE
MRRPFIVAPGNVLLSLSVFIRLAAASMQVPRDAVVYSLTHKHLRLGLVLSHVGATG